ncbi:MAG: hypothetical protein O2931_17265 [Planctomycetota bacterium]|nr:hypothetical protein [Planctomycetota bacterium]MDA1180532.1 hypothetical protein [Planctomycetota bacterium]
MGPHLTLTERLQRMEQALGQQCQMLGVRFAVDRPSIVHAFPSEWVAQLIEGLSLYALSTLPGAGDLLITAVHSVNGLEVEVAVSPSTETPAEPTDCDLQLSLGALHELGRCHDLASALGGRLFVQDCPDGGTAYTLTLGSRVDDQRVA